MQTLDVISINIWQILISLTNLLILFLVLKKLLYKPVRNMVAARQAELDERYNAADMAVESARELERTYTERIAGANDECDRLLKSAQANAMHRSDEIIAEAEERAAGMLRTASAEIELERKKAVSDMKREIADISVKLTEKMLDRELNEADQRGFIDSFIEGMSDNDARNE